jgi:hypothetical protein
MKTICKLLPLLALVFLSVAVYAQADTDVAIKPKSYFKLGITYLNNNVYLGRADTITTPSIMPKLSYTFKSGLYLSGGLDYVTNRSTKPLDGGNLEISWKVGYRSLNCFTTAAARRYHPPLAVS